MRCSPVGTVRPGEDDLSAGLRARVRVAGVVRELAVEAGEVPLDRVARLGQEACGFLPLEEAVTVLAVALQEDGGEPYVSLELQNSSVRPLRLVSLALAPGLAVRDLDRGALSLPVELPPAGLGLVTGLTVVVRLDVRCGEVRADGADALDVVSVVVDGGAGPAVGPLGGRVEGAQLLRRLVEQRC